MPKKRGSLVKPDMNGDRDEPASAKRSAAKRKVSLPSQPRPRKLSDGIVNDLPALDSLVLNGKDDSSDEEGSRSEPEESGASSDEGSFDGFLEGDDDDEEDDAGEDDDVEELSFEGDEDADGEDDDDGEESIDGDEEEESLESQLGKLGQVFLANEKKANSRPSSGKSDPVKKESEAGPSPPGKIRLADLKPSTSSASEEPSTSEPSKPDEYEHDSSDEEDLRNTVGNIPMEWYKDFAHIGYDLDGRRIIKPKQGDELDFFLDKMENPDFWRTVHDKMTGQKVVLSEEDVNLIKRIQKGKVGDATYNPYEPWVDFFTSKVLNMPVTAQPPHKRSFLPSKDEKERVSRLVHAIKKGWLTPKVEKDKEDDSFKFYLLWNAQDEAEPMRRVIDHIPAPKLKLPSHAESYNPPTEYLFNEKEKETWEKLAEEPWRRKYNFMPKKFDCLRKVPAYERFVRERFERCMDLYLAPRARRTRLTIEPEDLMPKLPKPRELQPFPTMQSLIYEGHTDMVRSISTEPTGQFLVSGSDDHTVKIWEVATGRCLKTYDVGAVVKSVAWCPSTTVSLIAVACDVYCYIINPGVGDKLLTTETDALLRNPPEQGDSLISARVKTAVEWQVPTDEQWSETNIRVIVKHFKPVKQVTWHGKGDYFATIMPEGLNRAVIIHQLSKRKSQQPFEKAKGLVQCALFHPIRPYVFVATKSCVRVYNLVKQELSKKLVTSMKWISSMAVHPGGDNILVGTYDTRVQWFDLDLSTKPYKVLRHHRKAVRAVAYHKRYPLFASCSDEGTVTIFHGMVYNDLLQNPLIVPVKVLRGHTIFDDFSVLDCCFHPTQPWVFSSGADFTIRLYT